MSEQHGPAHRGGTLGKPGIDWCYVTPGELEQARKNAAAIEAMRVTVAAVVAVLDSGFVGSRHRLEPSIKALRAVLGDPG